MRLIIILCSLLLLLGCQSTGKKHKPSPNASNTGRATVPASPRLPVQTNQNRNVDDPCAPIMAHDEKNYTAGGLYAPHISDSAPVGAIDVSKLVEPAPRDEPKSRFGNKSPYTVLGKQYWVRASAANYDERGVASWYGQKFNGRKTSSGEIYSVCEFTAAHKTLPLPSIVRVTHLGSGRSVIVRVNDRGPFHESRIIDLSYAAAIKLGLDKTGTAKVRVQTLNGDGSVTDVPDTLNNEPSPVPPNLPPETASNTTIQFGSFAQRENADRLFERLQSANIPGLELVASPTSNPVWWRVLAISVNNQDIQTIFEKIRQLGLPKPTLVNQKL
jgi:rare lipoprotein A